MTLAQSISEQDIVIIKKQLKENVGIDLKDFKTPFLVRRISERMMATGVKEGSEYARLLFSDPLEPLNLYNTFSINVTEFFRDPQVWDDFSAEVIPKLKQNKSSEIVNIWSAGCATGQETYSLAMMFYEAFEEKTFDFKITGTDMNKTSISVAENGKYELKALKGIPQWAIKKYFKPLGGELYQVKKRLKSHITFKIGDILSKESNSYDVIVCRNLLIYYGKTAQELLFKKFHTALKEKGFMVLGMNEAMIGTDGASLFKIINARSKIFQKKSDVRV